MKTHEVWSRWQQKTEVAKQTKDLYWAPEGAFGDRHQNRERVLHEIKEPIALVKDMQEGNACGKKLGLMEDELACYDAVETNDSAVKVLGVDCY